MMQNDFDYKDIQAINMANTAKNIKLIINRQESLKFKKTKHLKIVNKTRFILAIGVLTVSVGSFAFGISSLNKDNNIQSYDTFTNDQVSESIVVSNSTINNDEKIVVNENYYEKELLDKYCNIYSLDSNVVYKLIQEMTDNFTNDDYIKTNNPGFKFNNNSYNTKELGILCFVRHLYQIPEDFGINIDQIKSTVKNDNSEIREEYLVKQYSDIFGIDPVLVLAIEYQEASLNGEKYASEVYKKYNNPAGLISPSTNNFWKFPNKEAGIIEHIYQLKKHYIDNNLTTPEQIQAKYAPNGALNDPENLNNHWLANVKSFMKEIENNPNIFDEKIKTEESSIHKY